MTVLCKHREHRCGALGGPAASEERRRNLVVPEHVGHPPCSGTCSVGKVLRLSRIGSAFGNDRDDLSDPLACRIPVEHLKFRTFFDIYHDGDREARPVRPGEVWPLSFVTDEIAAHVSVSISPPGAKPEGQVRGTQSACPSPARAACAISARVANQTPSWLPA